ncbi:MAG: hypothetical protein RIR05_1898 [Bacteroidota bacterium]
MALTITTAHAQNAGTILRQEQELEKRKNLPTQIPKSLLEKKTTTQTPVQGEKILVKNFKFEGDIKQVSLDILNDLVKEYVGKNLTFDEIQNAVKNINDYYKSKGFFLANVILPKQEVKNGIVIININEGKLDPSVPYKLNKKDLRIPEERIKAYLDDALKDSLKQESLERGLLNINDNPGVASSANIEPGSTPGTSILLVDVTEGPLIDGSVTIDNYGSRYTGDIRGTLSVDINNPSGYGDIFNGTIVKAYDADFESKKISYEIPVGVSGLRLAASYTELNYGLGKELTTNPKSTGTAESYNVNVKYPIYRSAAEALLFNANYDKKLLYNTSTGTVTADKELQNYNAGLTYQLTDQIFGGGFSQADVVVTRGNLDLSGSATSLSDDQASTGAKTNGDFTKANLQLLRIQRGTEKLSFQFLGAAQLAQKNLDSSEKFSLGGPSGVRAYPGGEASGDEGYKYSLDAKYVLATATSVGDILGSIFYDYGRVRQYNDVGNISMTTPNIYSLSGWGVGLDLVAAGKFTIKGGWAHVLGGNRGESSGKDSDGRNESSRYWLLANVAF